MLACTVGNLDIVKLLLINSTTDVNVVDKSGINALYVSVYYGHLEIV
jgi:ankyrin repeat protein